MTSNPNDGQGEYGMADGSIVWQVELDACTSTAALCLADMDTHSGDQKILYTGV